MPIVVFLRTGRCEETCSNGQFPRTNLQGRGSSLHLEIDENEFLPGHGWSGGVS
jgi:hypothetical protein